MHIPYFRFYVQLPTEKAHDYHEGMSVVRKVETQASQELVEEVELPAPPPLLPEARIHPAVLEKIRQLVASGETKLYAIRKQLRWDIFFPHRNIISQ